MKHPWKHSNTTAEVPWASGKFVTKVFEQERPWSPETLPTYWPAQTRSSGGKLMAAGWHRQNRIQDRQLHFKPFPWAESTAACLTLRLQPQEAPILTSATFINLSESCVSSVLSPTKSIVLNNLPLKHCTTMLRPVSALQHAEHRIQQHTGRSGSYQPCRTVQITMKGSAQFWGGSNRGTIH